MQLLVNLLTEEDLEEDIEAEEEVDIEEEIETDNMMTTEVIMIIGEIVEVDVAEDVSIAKMDAAVDAIIMKMEVVIIEEVEVEAVINRIIGSHSEQIQMITKI